MVENTLCNILYKHFGFKEFKSSLQKEAIEVVIKSENDVFISMPTGSGKSLCYQFPSIYHSTGVSIIISPLLALIHDQISHLTKLKVCAKTINSKTKVGERDEIITDLIVFNDLKKSTKIRMLYVTPEMCQTSTFKMIASALCRHNMLNYFVIDEAHCVSEWGHDFRPDYLKLGKIRHELMPNIRCVALTATANERVEKDIIASLMFKDSKSFRMPVFRDNIFYDVQFSALISNPKKHLFDFLYKCLGNPDLCATDWNPIGSCIVYCRKREDCIEIAEVLTSYGLQARGYHAGLKQSIREEIQAGWSNGNFPVVAATISFGMGVDKSNVRAVCHWTIPKSLTAYYQESGRAGRDGRLSHCRIYYDPSEKNIITYLIKQSQEKQKEKSLKWLETMSAYIEYPKCRHSRIAEHFGDAFTVCRTLCDYCTNKAGAEKLATQFCVSRGPYSKRTAAAANLDDGEVYGKGDSFDDLGEGGGNNDTRDREDLSDLASYVKSELRRRAGNKVIKLEDSTNAPQGSLLKEPFSDAVSGISSLFRHQNLQRLISDVKTRIESLGQCWSGEIKFLVVDAEFRLFQESAVASAYRTVMAKLLHDVRKVCKDLEDVKECLVGEKKKQKETTIITAVNVSKTEDNKEPMQTDESVKRIQEPKMVNPATNIKIKYFWEQGLAMEDGSSELIKDAESRTQNLYQENDLLEVKEVDISMTDDRLKCQDKPVCRLDGPQKEVERNIKKDMKYEVENPIHVDDDFCTGNAQLRCKTESSIFKNEDYMSKNEDARYNNISNMHEDEDSIEYRPNNDDNVHKKEDYRPKMEDLISKNIRSRHTNEDYVEYKTKNQDNIRKKEDSRQKMNDPRSKNISSRQKVEDLAHIDELFKEAKENSFPKNMYSGEDSALKADVRSLMDEGTTGAQTNKFSNILSNFHFSTDKVIHTKKDKPRHEERRPPKGDITVSNKKSMIGSIVVEALNKYFHAKRFTDKAAFKALARMITERCLAHSVTEERTRCECVHKCVSNVCVPLLVCANISEAVTTIMKQARCIDSFFVPDWTNIRL